MISSCCGVILQKCMRSIKIIKPLFYHYWRGEDQVAGRQVVKEFLKTLHRADNSKAEPLSGP